MTPDTDLNLLRDRVGRLTEENKQEHQDMRQDIQSHDRWLRGAGKEEPGLFQRVASLEEFVGWMKRLAWIAIVGVLGVWGSLAWSIVQHFLAQTKGGP